MRSTSCSHSRKNLNSPCDRRQGDLRVHAESTGAVPTPHGSLISSTVQTGEISGGQHARKPRVSSLGGVSCLASLLQSRKIKPQH